MVWWMVAVAATQAVQGGLQAQSTAQAEKFKFQQQALEAEYKSKSARMNAGAMAQERQSQMKVVENQALTVGLRDAQVRAASYVQQAAQGVALNSASKYQARASQELMHVINRNNIEANRVETLNSARSKISDQLGSSEAYKGKAAANTLLGASINVRESTLSGLAFGGLGAATSLIGMAGLAKSDPPSGK